MGVKVNKDKCISFVLISILVMLVILIIVCHMMNIRIFSIVSGSMSPSIKEGSLIVNQKVPFETLKENDVITYYMKDQDIYVTHRIIEIDEEKKRILCKGDANQSSDDTFTLKSQYQGKMIAKIPLLGYVVTFIKSIWGKIICSVIVVLLSISIYHDVKANKTCVRSTLG